MPATSGRDRGSVASSQRETATEIINADVGGICRDLAAGPNGIQGVK